MKPLAVTTRRRSAALPDVPTLEEAGISGVEISGWQGFIGPKGAEGFEIDPGTPEDFAALSRTSTNAGERS